MSFTAIAPLRLGQVAPGAKIELIGDPGARELVVKGPSDNPLTKGFIDLLRGGVLTVQALPSNKVILR
jgi:hypothetical protein